MSLRVVVGSYMVRYPLGGMMSWVLQYLTGFTRLGHDVWFVEKAGWPRSCYDPVRDIMTDDCTYGTATVHALLARHGLRGRWCYVDVEGNYHGMSRERVQEVFRTADLFFDMGTHGGWNDEAAGCGRRVLIDGEPGFTQMKRQLAIERGRPLPSYDHYVTTGQNVGTLASSAPDAGVEWLHAFHPVNVSLFEPTQPPEGAAYTTVMNWQSYEPLEFQGATFGHKDRSFDKFRDLPQRTTVPVELAVSGTDVPIADLEALGWRVRDGHAVSMSCDDFWGYIAASAGEFGVCKEGFVTTRSGWFSDRSAAYLASGRPVVLQDTGFSAHLPCGEGLFAVDDADQAASALEEVAGDPAGHAKRAREIAATHLDASVVLAHLVDQVTAT